ncbi:E3 ubiquitin-protein ligase NEDD4-like [Sycon ciliatum]|uniref:E3 ubiquitin-protein ligase NEDD4-like n=1 Tax=Sycon ciliatum TaxID=27933 RepID=UPI0031F6EC5D
MSLRSLQSRTDPNARRNLTIRVVEGIGLAKKDIFGHSDPYVRIRVHVGKTRNTRILQEFTTKTVKRSLSPKWNQEFKTIVKPSANILAFDVFDENRVTRDDFLGQFTISPCDFAIPTEPVGSASIGTEFTCKLMPRSTRSTVRGSLKLHLKYSDGEPVSPGGVSPRQDSTLSESQLATWEVVEEPQTLPPGWEEKMDANGRVFFVDHSTRRTQWDRPVASAPPAQGGSVPPAAPAAAAPPPIPPRVRRQISEDANSAHRLSNASSSSGVSSGASSLPPAVSSPSAASSSSPNPLAQPSGDPRIMAALAGPLPSGWASQMAPNGRPFFIDHSSRSTSWVDPRLKSFTADEIANHSRLQQESVRAAERAQQSSDLGPLPAGWEERRTAEGRVFYIDHSTRSTQWDDPRSETHKQEKVNVPQYSRDYKQKYDYMRNKLKGAPSGTPNRFELKVRRKQILEDSYSAIALLTGNRRDIMKSRLWIDFTGEKGLDYGGVAREWFELLSHEMFNPYYGLFECSASDNYTLQINPNSGVCNEEHLSYFKFIGRVCGMAVFHGKLVDGFFVRPFYKMMLRKKITLADMESVDEEYFRSLNWILDNDPEDLDAHFCVDEEMFGQMTMKELKPGGADIPVTNANKKEYVDLVIQWRFVSRIKSQMDSFIEGFNELIPFNLYKIFDERELELLICGIDQIDVDDWRKHTRYRGRYNDRDQVIVWFWKAVGTFDNEHKARLLQFVTGTSRVPMNGFAHLQGSNGEQTFCIECWGCERDLPRAHTCFNRLDLPPYTSYHQLREKLNLAIENTEGFEGVD